MSTLDASADSTKAMVFIGVAVAAIVLLLVQYRASKRLLAEVEEVKGASYVAAEAGARAAGTTPNEMVGEMSEQRTDQED